MTTFNKVPKGYQNEGNQPKRSGVYLGVVRKNIDSQRMGRFLVWISDFGPDVEEYWVPVSYASPFAGATDVRDNDPGDKSQKGSQTAYGFWATPPDINNQLLCCFIDGDIANGFWFACIYQQNMNHMVPGIASHKPTSDPSMEADFPIGPPTVEYNKKRSDLGPTLTSKFEKDTMERPVFEPLASQLVKQGLNEDLARGPSNASARRESPSMVFGLSTPKGHSIVIDDGETATEAPNEFIRMRTKSGVQLLIHETSGYIYMITKNGDSWVEINDQGIDMYSKGPISMNSDADINIHAGGKVGIHGTTGVHIAGQKMTTYTAEDTTFFAEGDLTGYGTDVGFRANKNATLEAVKDVSLNAGKNILEGACGYASRNAKKILDNSGGASPHEVDPHEYMTEVVNRVPLHEPYGDHFDGTDDQPVGVDANGNPVNQVVNSDGTVTNEPVTKPENVTDDDISWITTTMFEEAVGEPDDGRAAVAEVIKVRTATGYNTRKGNPWKGSAKGVVLEILQFSCYNAGGSNYKSREAVGFKKMSKWKNDPRWNHMKGIAQAVINGSYQGGSGFQKVRGARAQLYRNVATATSAPWRGVTQVAKIANHTFYRDG